MFNELLRLSCGWHLEGVCGIGMHANRKSYQRYEHARHTQPECHQSSIRMLRLRLWHTWVNTPAQRHCQKTNIKIGESLHFKGNMSRVQTPMQTAFVRQRMRKIFHICICSLQIQYCILTILHGICGFPQIFRHSYAAHNPLMLIFFSYLLYRIRHLFIVSAAVWFDTGGAMNPIWRPGQYMIVVWVFVRLPSSHPLTHPSLCMLAHKLPISEISHRRRNGNKWKFCIPCQHFAPQWIRRMGDMKLNMQSIF